MVSSTKSREEKKLKKVSGKMEKKSDSERKKRFENFRQKKLCVADFNCEINELNFLCYEFIVCHS